MKSNRSLVKLIALMIVLSMAFSGCGLVSEEECFDGLSISTDHSESHLRSTGDSFCRSKGFDRQINTSARNGKIVKICCKKDGIL